MNAPTIDSLAASKKRGPIFMAEALELLGIARRTMGDWIEAGKIIAPSRMGNGPLRWPRRELLAWIDAGYPTPAEWERMKRSERRGAFTEQYA